MYPGAAFRGVQAQAGLGIGVVGNLGATIRLNSVVGIARCHYSKTARHQQ
jgi:hypothetical protein